MPDPVAIGFLVKSFMGTVLAGVTGGHGGRTYNQVLAESLEVGVPNGRFREDRRDTVVPVGRGIDYPRPRVAPVPIVPQMAPEAPYIPAIALPRTSSRPQAPRVQADPVETPVTIMPVPGPNGRVFVGGSSPQTTSERPMDLGALIGNLGGQYIQARYGQSPPPQVNIVDDTFGVGSVVPFPSIGIPGVDVIDEPPSSGKGWVYDPSANCGKGKWRKKSRRRRKRLATASDIKDLASLGTVLKPGEVKTWIATHS